MLTIEFKTVDDHEQYVGRKAVLCEFDRSLFVVIVGTSRCWETVQHADGQMQKAPWSRIFVELNPEHKNQEHQ